MVQVIAWDEEMGLPDPVASLCPAPESMQLMTPGTMVDGSGFWLLHKR